MPKRSEWTDLPPPATPLQRAAYLDACTAWLVAEPDAADDALEVRTAPTASIVGDECDDALARSRDRARDARPWRCAACGARVGEDRRMLIANPFSQQCVVATCAAHSF